MKTATETVSQFVRRNLTHGAFNYREEASRLFSLMNEEDRDEFLRQALVGIITDVARRRTRDAFASATQPRGEDDEPSHAAKPIEGPSTPSSPRPKQEQNHSRMDRHRGWWTQLMTSTSPTFGGRKEIGKMNAEELTEAIRLRESHANQELRAAEQYRALLKLLIDDKNATTVEEITEIPDHL